MSYNRMKECGNEIKRRIVMQDELEQSTKSGPVYTERRTGGITNLFKIHLFNFRFRSKSKSPHYDFLSLTVHYLSPLLLHKTFKKRTFQSLKLKLTATMYVKERMEVNIIERKVINTVGEVRSQGKAEE